MAFEQIGLEAVLEGVGDFISDGEALNDTVAGMGSAFDAGASLIESAGGIIGDALGGMVDAALDLASSAGSALVDFFADSFSGALEAEQTIARLGQVIESTGGVAGVTVSEAEALADQFKGLAGGSDDAVLSIIDMGLRMGTISEEEMPAFIQTTLDLAAVTGDAGKAAQLMARAQEDPLGVLGALRKEGILVTESTQAQMQAMIDAGDTAGAYALLMGTVEAATAGAAETMAATTAGSWAIFTETIADAGESIVGAFLPAINSIAAPILESVVPAIESFAGVVGVAITDTVIPTITNFAASVIANFETAKAQFQPVIDAVNGLLASFAASMPMIQDTVQTMSDFVIAQFNTLSPTLIANVTSTLTSLTAFWTAHGDEIMAVIAFAFEFISATVGTTLTLISGLIASTMQVINGDWSGAWATIQATLTTSMNSILAIVGTDLDTFTSTWTTNWEMAQTIVETVWGNMLTSITTFINNIITAISSAILSFLGTWQTNWTSAQTIVTTVLGNMLTNVGAAVANMVTAFTSTDWGAVGSNVISNIVGAINNAAGSLAQSAADAAWNAYQAMLNALGMHSPSPMLMQVGEDFAVNVAVGIEDNAYRVANEAIDLAATAVDCTIGELQASIPAVENTARGVGDAIVRGINFDGVCEQVGDAAYQIGASCINDALNKGAGAINWDIMPPTSIGGSGGGSSGGSGTTRGGGSVSVTPVTTGGITTGSTTRSVTNTYQYAPIYGGTPVSPQRDFELMQVLAGA